MQLKNLVKNVKNFGDLEISNVCREHEKVKKNDAFFCFSKDKATAFERCEAALKNGAAVCFSHFDFENERILKTNDPRSLFAKACAAFYENCWHNGNEWQNNNLLYNCRNA